MLFFYTGSKYFAVLYTVEDVEAPPVTVEEVDVGFELFVVAGVLIT